MSERFSDEGRIVRDFYQERLDRFTAIREREAGLGLRLGWLRVGVFLVGFGLYVLWDVSEGGVAVAAGAGVVAAVGAFLFLVAWHRRVRRRERDARARAEVNRAGLARLARDWSSLPASPIEGARLQHPYALDLDVCGEASLFRLLSTVTLPPGQATLREWLMRPAPPEEVHRRQEAVGELASNLEFRETLEVTGRLTEPPDPGALDAFLSWAEGDAWLSRRPWLRLGAWALPLGTGILAALQLVGKVEGPWWLLTVAASFGLASMHRASIHRFMEAASGGPEGFGRYATLLTVLRDTHLEAPLLKDLQEAVRSSPVGAPRELLRLGRRTAWADIRYSAMAHAPLQLAFAWDLHVLSALERWKKRSGPHVRGWLDALGALEALAALAALKADHPGWAFPDLSEGSEPGIRTRGLGHPLLPPEACVCNDVDVGPAGSFLFVTGSNMSGKSTLLRAIGINAVLAQAGGPVCATQMALTPLRVHTSMRTADSLSQGVSQYMAELNRIRLVVEGARAQGEGGVLYLLDEPLQGTNEAERRVAVQTILGHLLASGAIGAVATHDLQLDGTDLLAEAARPTHLEGKVEEGEGGPLLTFDYRLRPGRATSTNALALLRAVGLGE